MGRRITSNGITIMIMTVMVFSIASILLPTSSAIGAPAVSIVLDRTNAVADVAPGSDGIVVFTGVVRAEAPVMPPGQVLVITLQAEAGGWAVSGPSSMEFTNEIKEQNFTISVQVPLETSTKTTGQLTVAGRWRYSPGTMGGTIDPVTAVINIDHFYRFSISPELSLETIEREDITEIDFKIMNEGNGADILAMEVLNREELEIHGIIAREKVDDMAIPEKQRRDYPVVIVLSSTTDLGRFEIEVRVHSVQAKSSGKDIIYETSSTFIEVVEKNIEDDPGTDPAGIVSIDEDPPEDGSEYPGTSDYSPLSSEGGSGTLILFGSILFIVGVVFLGAFIIFRKKRFS